MSWESSAQYYRLINEAVRHRLGGAHSAQLLLWSVDFAGIKQLQHDGRWDVLGDHMLDAARRLQAGGAELLVICTNTMHTLAARIEAQCPLPLLHIADPTAAAIRQAGLRRVGLLGTAFTMEQAFYRDRLQDRFGLQVLVPEANDRRIVHDIIYQELIAGVVSAHIAAGLRRRDRAPGRTRCRSDHPRLYRNHVAGPRRGQPGAAVRHHHPARPGSGGCGTGLSRALSLRPALPAR